MKELAYICQEIKNPLSGIRFTNSLLESTDLTEDQTQFLETSGACEKQMLKIIRDVDLQIIEDGLASLTLIMLTNRLQLIVEMPEAMHSFFVLMESVLVQVLFMST